MLSPRLSTLQQRLQERLATTCRLSAGHRELTLETSAEHLLATVRQLRDDPELAFQQLVDACGVDYSQYGQSEWEIRQAPNTGFSRGVMRGAAADHADAAGRFAVVYHLLSHMHNWRLRLRVRLAGEPPVVPSLIEIWPAANWFEREAFDLFGILFDGHPDLRRILTDYGFVGHPFRKDFPLSGHVEMRYDPETSRVIYEPVRIEPRVLVPRVVRSDNRYQPAAADQNHA